MEKGAGLQHDDVARTVRVPLTALRALVEAAMAHTGLPAETAACLRQMAVHVAQLQEATAALAGAGDGSAKVVDITRLDRPRTALRDLVGADLADRLRPEAGPGGQPGGERPHLLLRLPGDGPRLTPQEQRILDLIGRGHTNRQIATELYLAEKTVKNYVSNMLRKLGMERRTQAAIYATSGDRPHAPTGTAP